MKIHEYQARELLREYGIAVPRGILAETANQAAAAVDSLGGEAMLKGQVLTGGRGKAGAIRKATSQQAKSLAADILTMNVKNFPVRNILVTELIDIQAEYYLALTIDREAKSLLLVLSAAGGMDIEEIAANQPEKIRYYEMAGKKIFTSAALKEWLSDSFSDQSLLDQALSITQNMYRLFREKDCSLVEINPLAQTSQNQLVAADAKIVFDDNALARHPDIAGLSNPEEYTDDEHRAKAAGLSFVSLSGQIGCMVNGAGLAMATMDGIKLAGGAAANFLDVGGSSNPQKILEAMKILLGNDRLKVILINIFGGITRCDDVARGILSAREQLDIPVPMVIRLIGTNEKQAHEMLCQNGLIVVRNMTEAIQKAVNCAKGGTEQ